MAEEKFCIVCGMPLRTVNDYPSGADMVTCEHCRYCGTKDGLYPYEQLITGMAGYFMKVKGLLNDEAMKAAKEAVDSSVAVKTGKLVVPAQ